MTATASPETGNVVLLTDAGGTITAAGGPAFVLLGRNASELVGVDIAEAIGMDFTGLRNAAGSGRGERLEFTLPAPARSDPVAVMVVEFDPPVGFGVILSPATNTELDRTREANVALSSSNRQLEAFASVAAHDLQEPIRKIRAFSDRVRGLVTEGSTERAIDYLDRIDGAAARMQTLISDLLGLARVAGRVPDREQVDLTELVRGVRADLTDQIDESHAVVGIGELPQVVADRHQFHQLFLNLIGNSIKYRHPGRHPQVSVTATTDDGSVVITVSDNGIGFDDHYLPKIFEPFERLWGRDDYPGTGVGLALCRAIVERHGGTITARGRPGEGADFVVTLPSSNP